MVMVKSPLLQNSSSTILFLQISTQYPHGPIKQSKLYLSKAKMQGKLIW